MKKALQNLASLFVLLVVITSCSGDDNNDSTNNNNNQNPSNGHVVEYKISIDEPILSSISYKDGSGNIIAVTESLTGVTTWSKSVTVNGAFIASVLFEADTEIGSPVNYLVQIYVDGALKHQSNSTAIGSSNVELSYELQ